MRAFFEPASIAVIGATEKPGSVGRALMVNLAAFRGRVLPINPGRPSVLGHKAWPDIGSLPERPELAVIATPAQTVPNIIRQCAEARVPAAIIISAGFRECGPAGAELERQVRLEARKGAMRILGPNCLGLMTPHSGLNASFAAASAQPGNIALLSQSGALCTAILDWSLSEGVGFSAFVSIGSMLDVGWADLIYYLGDDPHTKSILCYMESVGDARSFLSAAREVALTKPIIIIKAGRSESAARAAASHTGALTGNDKVLDAAFRRAGILRVNTIEELFDMAEVLAKQPRPAGPRLAIVTNAGGPGVLATDMLVGAGGEIAALSDQSMTALNELLPPHWSHNNPIDLLGDANADCYAKTVELVGRDPGNDGVLVILTPQAMTDATATASALAPLSRLEGKPLLASWMGGTGVAAGEAILNQAGIPTFKYPDRAANAFQMMWRYSQNLKGLYETPAFSPLECGEGSSEAIRCSATTLINSVRREGRSILTEFESKQVIAAYGIPTVETKIALTEDEAAEMARQIGFPVVVKLLSETLTHKTELDGVHLDLRDAVAVRHAWRGIEKSVAEKAGRKHFQGVTVQQMVPSDGYELILGSSIDAQFGPVLLFGAGGQLVEIFKDLALGLPPLTATLARRLMEQTRIFMALKGVRGRSPVDLARLDEVLVRFSHLVAEQRWIKEVDINPLRVSPKGIFALDARIILHDPKMKEEELPTTAIRPYPIQYVKNHKLKDGTAVAIRPIRPEDEKMIVDFHHSLSERSVYYRYFGPLRLEQRIAHERLARLCFIDYDRETALVVEHKNEASGALEIVGVGRLSKLHGKAQGEFAIVVSDAWQNRGLGKELLRLLVQIGKDEKLERITGTILPDNRQMQKTCQKLGFAITHIPGEPESKAEIVL